MNDIPALISIDCHVCNQHVAVPVTITDRGLAIAGDGLEAIGLTIEAPDLHQRLIRHMEHSS